MRISIIIFLTFAILSANFSRLFVFAGFEMNRAFIAAELCINKDKPQMHCNGKCYLSKKLEQAREKQKQQEKEIQKNSFQEAFLFSSTDLNFSLPLIKVENAIIPNFHIFHNTNSIFQPPRG